jgi:3-methyladenine DNA glycosylase AlkD
MAPIRGCSGGSRNGAPVCRNAARTADPAASHRQAHAALLMLANPAKAQFLARFFKTGKGQYAEGDRFLGITAPVLRQLARQFRQLSLRDCTRLLDSPYNEERLLSLLILVERYRTGNAGVKKMVYRLYVKERKRINNWNLVDASAPYILGAHLLQRDRSMLHRLVHSRSLWDRRIAVVATFAFIRENDFGDTLKLTEQLLADEHDLMHKACGWMLREAGKRGPAVLEDFLRRHYRAMPRTMLRYAIERFPAAKRKRYLTGRV